jgi:hypothetical protein
MRPGITQTCFETLAWIRETSRWFLHHDFLLESRKSCLDCVRKHLAQAEVLMEEAKLGYPEHKWLAVGHLGEASAESLQEYPEFSDEIRKHRLAYMKDDNYAVPIVELIKKASALAGQKRA